jgi:hypothetical protein
MAPHQIREYKPPIASLSQESRLETTLTIAEARTPKSFMFRPAVPDLQRLRLANCVPSETSPSTTCSTQKDLQPVMCTLHIRPSTNTHQVEKYAQPPRHANSLTLQISIIPPSLQSLQRVPSDPFLHRAPTARSRLHPSKKP